MNIICVTNRKIAEKNGVDFLKRIEEIAKGKPFKIILREKDMEEEAYEKLAKECFCICKKNGVDFAVNKFINAAKKIGARNIHLSMEDFLTNIKNIESFENIGVSIHSVEEAIKAESLGADYLIAGHIFETDCKKGISPRGISFLKEVCERVKIPVFAIGGINKENAPLCVKNGAAGVCAMSGFFNFCKGVQANQFLKSF